MKKRNLWLVLAVISTLGLSMAWFLSSDQKWEPAISIVGILFALTLHFLQIDGPKQEVDKNVNLESNSTTELVSEVKNIDSSSTVNIPLGRISEPLINFLTAISLWLLVSVMLFWSLTDEVQHPAKVLFVLGYSFLSLHLLKNIKYWFDSAFNVYTITFSRNTVKLDSRNFLNINSTKYYPVSKTTFNFESGVVWLINGDMYQKIGHGLEDERLRALELNIQRSMEQVGLKYEFHI